MQKLIIFVLKLIQFAAELGLYTNTQKSELVEMWDLQNIHTGEYFVVVGQQHHRSFICDYHSEKNSKDF